MYVCMYVCMTYINIRARFSSRILFKNIFLNNRRFYLKIVLILSNSYSVSNCVLYKRFTEIVFQRSYVLLSNIYKALTFNFEQIKREFG